MAGLEPLRYPFEYGIKPATGMLVLFMLVMFRGSIWVSGVWGYSRREILFLVPEESQEAVIDFLTFSTIKPRID
jgi:hypothetical protein